MLLVYRHALGLSAGALEAMFGVYAGAVTGAVTALTALAGVLIQPAARALDALRWRGSVGMVGLLVRAAGLAAGVYAVQVGVAARAVRCGWVAPTGCAWSPG